MIAVNQANLEERVAALKAKVITLEADLVALAADRKWIIQCIATLAIELERGGKNEH